MSFRPGETRDLLRPEPHSTTGRAIASLGLRRLNEAFAAFPAERFDDARARHAFSAFRREMDALLPGRPKARVAVLASPFVRVPLERVIFGGDLTAIVEAACAGLFALQLGPGLTRSIHVRGAPTKLFALEPPRVGTLDEGAFPVGDEAIAPLETQTIRDLPISAAAGEAFGMKSRPLGGEGRRTLEHALRLLDAAAPTEAMELGRFFRLVVPLERGVERRVGVLGLDPSAPALDVALTLVEQLALAKLSLYARLLDVDARALEAPAAHAVRRAFLHALGVVRHPLAASEEAKRHLQEDAAIERLGRVESEEPLVAGVVAELSRLLDRSPGDAKRRTP
ncbi:MAG: hypothetical protein GXY23_12775 [Myxococcales bacterium]|nr:hypothetical protein [Myxococcales bacterium]